MRSILLSRKLSLPRFFPPRTHFDLPDSASELTPKLIAALTRVVKLMSKNRLITDLRGNRGGSSNYVRIVAELLTGRSPPQSSTLLRSTKLLKDAFDGYNATEAELTDVSAYRSAI